VTVLVGVQAGECVAVAADRLQTYHETSIQVDVPRPKIRAVGDNVIITVAGDGTSNLDDHIEAEGTVEDPVSLVRDAWWSLQWQLVREQVYMPRNLSNAEDETGEEEREKLRAVAAEVEVPLHVMVAASWEDGRTLLGGMTDGHFCRAEARMAAVGSGSYVAMGAAHTCGVLREVSDGEDAVRLAYYAARKASVCDLVGEVVDAVLLTHGTVQWFAPDDLEASYRACSCLEHDAVSRYVRGEL